MKEVWHSLSHNGESSSTGSGDAVVSCLSPRTEPAAHSLGRQYLPLILAAIIIASAPVVTACGNVQYSPAIIDTGAFQFSFDYPAYYEKLAPTYRPQPYGFSDLWITLRYPAGGPSTRSISRFSILVYDPATVGPAVMIEQEIRIRSDQRDFSIIERSTRMVDSVKAELISYYAYPVLPETGLLNRLYLNRTAFFMRGDTSYEVTLYVLAEEANSYSQDFEHVLNTFKFRD